MLEVGKKYKVSNLYKMRKFYEIFSDEKLYPLGTKLCWSHYRELLTIKNILMKQMIQCLMDASLWNKYTIRNCNIPF